MFDCVDNLENDLRQFTLDGFRLPEIFKLGSSEVGKALLQLAAGKPVEALANETELDAARFAIRREAATRFVSDIMLASGSNHFTTLGVSPDADANVIRDNFRRLMALVHPDAQPVGFPADAASRVNRAYAVLSESSSRAAYAAREFGLTPFGPVVFNAEPIPRRPVTAERESVGTVPVSRFSGWLQALRARQSLLWVAALLLLPLGAAITSFFSYEAPQQLVEARSKVKLSTETGSPQAIADAGNTASVAKTGLDTRDSTAPSAMPASPSVAESTTSGERYPASKAKSPPAAQLKYSFALDDSAKSRELGAKTPAPVTPAAPANAYQPAQPQPRRVAATAITDVVAKAPSLSLAPIEPARAPTVEPAAVAPPAPTIAVANAQAATPPRPAVAERSDAGASALAPTRVKPSDAEAVVIRFINAYESGSISAFGQLFAASMSSRRQMLNDYERVFSATRQRTIKFNQLKHSPLGERLATSGYAVVTTTDQDNRIVTQRVFLEFEIGRDRGEARIDRLANYVIN